MTHIHIGIEYIHIARQRQTYRCRERLDIIVHAYTHIYIKTDAYIQNTHIYACIHTNLHKYMQKGL